MRDRNKGSGKRNCYRRAVRELRSTITYIKNLYKTQNSCFQSNLKKKKYVITNNRYAYRANCRRNCCRGCQFSNKPNASNIIGMKNANSVIVILTALRLSKLPLRANSSELCMSVSACVCVRSIKEKREQRKTMKILEISICNEKIARTTHTNMPTAQIMPPKVSC